MEGQAPGGLAHVAGDPLPPHVEPLTRVLATLAVERGERVALRHGELEVTFAQLERQVRGVMAMFERRGLGAGATVGYLGHNHPRFLAVLLAAMRSGVMLAPLNWRQKARELSYILADSGAGLLLVDAAFADVLAGTDQSWTVVGTDFGEDSVDAAILANDEHPHLADAFGDPDAPTLLLYTSGTTGRPKGAQTSERAVTLARAQEKGTAGFDDWTDSEVLLSPLPLFHIGGISWALCGLERGCTVILSTDTSPAGILDTCIRSGVTRTFMVPQLVRGLIAEMRSRGAQLGALKAIHYGAAAMDPALLEMSLAQLGCRFLQYFGMTEMAGTLTILPPEAHDLARPELLRSVGRVLPGAALEIRDAAGKVAPRGVNGEIWAAGPTMMLGYRGLPQATAEAIVDGWYRTGDGGRLDADGYLFLTDRIKDMIVSGGENVYPVEVEAVLREHPAVGDAAVYGEHDPVWGERVCASVELIPGSMIEPDAILAFVRGQIAGYKCPKVLRIVEALPRTASGKVQRAKARPTATAA